MSGIEERKKQVRDQLNQVSPSFCLAKWLQVTMHLHSGHNQSCCHSPAHKTPLSELQQSPAALHNTLFKKTQRQMMKRGEKPAECGYCWSTESLPSSPLSERTLKSSQPWALDSLERIAQLPADADVTPTYLEVSFSNVCNFRCSYCSANFSTRWKEDLDRNGPYSTRAGAGDMDILEEESNPYIRAFWEWWPSLLKDLKVFRITGGEPLLSKNTFLIMEDLARHPRPHLDFLVNSNLGVSAASYQKFITLAKDLTANKKVKSFTLATSADAWGNRAEYLRDGMQFSRFQNNIETFLKEVPQAEVAVNSAFNNLSLTSSLDLLKYILKLKRQHATSTNLNPIYITLTRLIFPEYQSVQILPPSFQSYMTEIQDFMFENRSTQENAIGFDFFEYDNAVKILEAMKQSLPPQAKQKSRKDFVAFFTEHDLRRGTDFHKTFPEMKSFWEDCLTAEA